MEFANLKDTGTSIRPYSRWPTPPEGIVTVVVFRPSGVSKETAMGGKSVIRTVDPHSSKLSVRRMSWVNGPRAFSFVVVIVAVPLKVELNGAAHGADGASPSSSTWIKSV